MEESGNGNSNSNNTLHIHEIYQVQKRKLNLVASECNTAPFSPVTFQSVPVKFTRYPDTNDIRVSIKQK